jgi:glycosyltransferase involved in cell wall biosynthesis
VDKVYFITGSFPPKTGGELYNYKLYDYLEKAGIEQEYIDLHQKRAILRLSWIPVIGSILTYLVLAIMLHRCNGLLVEDHYFSRSLVLVNIIHRYFKRGKIIIIVHHFDNYESDTPLSLKQIFSRLREKIVLGFATTIVTVSEYTKREIISLGINPCSVLVLPPGLERPKLDFLSNYQGEMRGEKIICVANCIPRKGIIDLIKAFSLIEKRGFKLHIVGKVKENSSYYKNVISLIKELGLTQDVFLDGRLEQEELNRLYLASKIFILPSLKEGFGIVLLEAMYYGLPIVTTKISAMPELVTDGENGLLVPVADPMALAEAISKLIENPDLREQMGERGRQRILHSYHWDTTSSKFLSVIQNLSD